MQFEIFQECVTLNLQFKTFMKVPLEHDRTEVYYNQQFQCYIEFNDILEFCLAKKNGDGLQTLKEDFGISWSKDQDS